MVWSEAEPWLGDPSALIGLSAALRQAGDAIRDGQTTLMQQGGALGEAWTGDAAARFLDSTAHLHGRCGSFLLWAQSCADAIDDHHRELTEILEQAAVATVELAAAHSTRDACAATVADLRIRVRNLTLTDESTPIERQLPRTLANAEEQLRRATLAIGAASDHIAALAQRRHAAESALLASIGGLSPLSAREQELARTLGVPARGLTGADIAIEVARRLREDPSQWGYLLRFLDIEAYDVGAQEAFWTALGGDGAAELARRLAIPPTGDHPDDEARRRAALGAVRDSFAACSQDWTSEQAIRFAGRLLQGDHAEDDAMISWLFDGPPYAGAEIALLLAQRALEFEVRSDGRLLALPQATGAAFDATAAFLAALGTHPEAAYRFLSDNSGNNLTNPADRRIVDYLFRERDWSLDGFHGVLALLAGAEQVGGGPMAPEAGPSGVQARLASIVSAAIAGFCANDSFTVERFSPAGALAIAAIVQGNLPAFTYLVTSNKHAARVGGVEAGSSVIPGAELVLPSLSLQDLSVLMSRAGADPVSAATLSLAVDGHADWLISQIAHYPVQPDARQPVPVQAADGATDGAQQSARDHADVVLELMSQAGAIRGAAAGSLAATRIQRAAANDARTKTGVEALSSLAYLLPVPANPYAAWAQAVGLDLTVEAVMSRVVDMKTEAQAIANSDDELRVGELRQDVANLSALARNLQSAGVATAPVPPSDADAAALQTWVEANGEAIQRSYLGTGGAHDSSAFSSYGVEYDKAKELVARSERKPA